MRTFFSSKGQISLEYGMQAQIHVIGVEIHEGTHIKLVTDKREFGDNCDHRNLSRPVLSLSLSLCIFTRKRQR